MPDPVASPDDVRLEYDTDLDDPTISSHIQRANRDVERHNDAAAMDEDRRRDLEAALAAYRIATTTEDRAADQVNSGRSSVRYEAGAADTLLARVRELDPSGELPPEGRQEAKFEVF